MKVAEAIEAYLSHQRLRGLEPRSVRTTGYALRTVFEPVLAGKMSDLAVAGVGEVLQTTLRRRISHTRRKPLTPTTRELYLNAAKTFLAWAIGKGLLRANPLAQVHAPAASKLSAQVPEPHQAASKQLGVIVKELRVACGLTRDQLEIAAGLPFGTVQRIEQGRLWPSWATLDKLCAHPSMRTLIETCVRQGVELGVRPPHKPN